MTASIVIFAEEPSARIVMSRIAREIVSSPFQVLEHAGKNDLEKSVTRKINAWKSPQTPRFIVTRDLDAGTRQSVRQRLLRLVPDHALDRTKIRIVIPELEAWYLGDPDALYGVGLIKRVTADRLSTGAMFRNLCTLQNAKAEFKKLVGTIGQIAAAELIGPALKIETNRSVNLRAFVEALRWADAEIAHVTSINQSSSK